MTVVNSGLPGEVAARTGKTRLTSELFEHRPEALLLMEGTNDLFFDDVGVEIGIDALDDMVRDASARGIRVFLATIPPQRLGGRRDRVARIIPGFNDEVRAVAARRSAVLVDVYAAMQPDLDRLIGIDDLHPTEMGFDVIARTFFDAIRTNLESTPLTSVNQR
jgi:lysophospholipase L1-like esterase